MLTSATSGPTDLTRGAYVVKTGYSFPVAKVTDKGADAQAAGAVPIESHYSDAPFTLPIIVRGADGAAVNAAVDVMTRSLRDNGITLSENGAELRTAKVRNVQVDSRTNHGKWALVVYAGERRPGFRGMTSETPVTIAGGIGTFAIEGTGGDLAADTDLALASGADTNLIACGIKAAPDAAYDPLDTYAGSAASMGNANVDYGLVTAQTVDVNANRGAHYAVAKVATNATHGDHTSFGVESANAGASIEKPKVTGVASGNLLLGKVRVPVAEVPDGSTGTIYSAPEAVASATTGSTLYPLGNGSPYRTFTSPTAGRPYKAMFKVKCAAGVRLRVQLADYVNGSGVAVLARTSYTTTAATDGWVTFVFDEVFTNVAAGQDLIVTIFTTDGSNFQCYGPDSTESLRVYELWLYPWVVFDATNLVRASCTEANKTATLYALTRIPAESALIVAATFTAGEGISYSDGSVYPYDGAVVTGAAMAATHGDSDFAVPPGDSMLVVHAGGGANATGTLRVTERHLGLS
jgi:hypothetical protein